LFVEHLITADTFQSSNRCKGSRIRQENPEVRFAGSDVPTSSNFMACQSFRRKSSDNAKENTLADYPARTPSTQVMILFLTFGEM
jgi:hypothetical protein